ncbi:MAG: DUF481 domain-containing protein [Phycisphaerales bacterium]|nr:DUF481 domain-containing protein [Phycisphaerales bacterium]
MESIVKHTATALVLALASGSVLGAAEKQPETPAEETTPAEEVIDPVMEHSFFRGWDGSAEVGMNGSTGNTERFNLRAGINAERDTDRTFTTTSLTYTYAKEDGNDTENRLRFQLRNDWKLADSRWFVFAQGSAEYDDFQDWDVRLDGFLGLGYRFIDTERTRLNGRLGTGLSYDIGGSDNRIRLEGLAGADIRHQITERQLFRADVEYLPEYANFAHYRIRARASYEIIVDPEVNLSLKLGVENRYDSDPGEGFKRNDLDYFAVLAWSF